MCLQVVPDAWSIINDQDIVARGGKFLVMVSACGLNHTRGRGLADHLHIGGMLSLTCTTIAHGQQDFKPSCPGRVALDRRLATCGWLV
jgi:hypothetical protein